MAAAASPPGSLLLAVGLGYRASRSIYAVTMLTPSTPERMFGGYGEGGGMSDKPVSHQPVRPEYSRFTCGSCSLDRSEPCHHYAWTMEAGKHRICCVCWCDAPDRKPILSPLQQSYRAPFVPH